MVKPIKITPIDEQLSSLKGGKKVMYITAMVCFIAVVTFVFIHLGFVMETDHSTTIHDPFLPGQKIWIVNGCLGLFGGFLFDYKHPIIAALSGLIAALAITGTTMLYLSWRDSMFVVEIILPLLTGFIGVGVYKSLMRNRG